jgi:hypothetical protein
VVNFTLLKLYPQRNNSQYPMGKRLGLPQSRYGRYEEEKNIFALPGIEP